MPKSLINDSSLVFGGKRHSAESDAIFRCPVCKEMKVRNRIFIEGRWYWRCRQCSLAEVRENARSWIPSGLR